jgi:hypothetical protein
MRKRSGKITYLHTKNDRDVNQIAAVAIGRTLELAEQEEAPKRKNPVAVALGVDNGLCWSA